MQTAQHPVEARRYAKCVEVSKRIRWDIDRDVIRGRQFDFSKKFLPDGISKISELEFLDAAERRLLSQIQGRTYANMFGLVERFIGAKILEVSRDHWLGDQTALEALVRFSDEELKHQELFRRIERMVAAGMPAGYRFEPQPNDVAAAVLERLRANDRRVRRPTPAFPAAAHQRIREAAALDVAVQHRDRNRSRWRRAGGVAGSGAGRAGLAQPVHQRARCNAVGRHDPGQPAHSA